MTSGIREQRTTICKSPWIRRKRHRFFVGIAISGLLVATSGLAGAQRVHPASSSGHIGPTKGQVIGISVGIAAAGAAIVTGFHYLIHHHRDLTGCAAVTPDGLRLQDESDRQTYSLVGRIAGISPEDRIRVCGRKVEAEAGDSRLFIVERLSRDFGYCSAKAEALE